MRRPILALTAVLALLVAAPAAPAASTVAGDVELLAGPELAGGSVVWGEATHGGGLAVRAAATGRRRTTLFRWAAPAGRTRLSLDGLAASATHVAMVRTAIRRAPARAGAASELAVEPVLPAGISTVLIAGRLGGPFVRIAGRRGAPARGGCRPQTLPREPAISGSRLVYIEEEILCTARDVRSVDRIMLADLGQPGSAPRVLATGTSAWRGGEPARGVAAPRVAGHFAAWQVTTPGASRARAIDLRTGRTVQRVDRVAGGSRGDILEWFAVGADGSLAVSFQPDAKGHALAVRRRGGATRVLPQRLPSGSADYDPSTAWAALDRGCVAVVGGLRRFALWVTDRAGRGSAVVRFSPQRPLVGDPAFAGGYAAWADGRPRSATLYRARAGC